MKPISRSRFWMVYSPSGRAPTYRHTTRQAADNEAKRLANANPSQEFFVLKAMAGVVADAPKLRKIELAIDPDDEIPF